MCDEFLLFYESACEEGEVAFRWMMSSITDCALLLPGVGGKD